MISFAQNQEDVVLHRLLEVVPEGRYVDVGAGHPVLDNVTYDLYLSGWRGINVEPMRREVELLRSERPDDLTVEVALGAATGRITLYEAPVENRGATTSRTELVDHYRGQGEVFTPFDVGVRTLASVLEEFGKGDIHVLKIDVEGMEGEVLSGADLPRFRPWVLLIEATVPNTQIDASMGWESLVLDAGYRLTLFDGLNRFYVRDDLEEVAAMLSVPANVFDRWEHADMQRLRDEVRLAEDQTASLVAESDRYIASLSAELAERDRYLASLQEELQLARRRAAVAEEYASALEEERTARDTTSSE